ncbi:MAG TPA: amino acid ABC transporter permease [Coleofasciculaceae cyanobacterium]
MEWGKDWNPLQWRSAEPVELIPALEIAVCCLFAYHFCGFLIVDYLENKGTKILGMEVNLFEAILNSPPGFVQAFAQASIPTLGQAGGINLDFSKIAPDVPYILSGVWETLRFTLTSAIFGFALGTVLAIFKISEIKPLKWFADFYTSIFRGTPLILQIVLIYYATPQLTGFAISAFIAGVITFSLNSAAYTSETIRGGIAAVDRGQREASLTLGVKYPLMMWDIILPQAFKNILPSLVNESIALLKDSSLVSVIGVEELMRRSQIIAGQKFIFFEPYIFVGAVYYVMIMGLTWFAERFERRMRLSD